MEKTNKKVQTNSAQHLFFQCCAAALDSTVCGSRLGILVSVCQSNLSENAIFLIKIFSFMHYHPVTEPTNKSTTLSWSQRYKSDTLSRSLKSENDTLFSGTSPYAKIYEYPPPRAKTIPGKACTSCQQNILSTPPPGHHTISQFVSFKLILQTIKFL